MLKLKVESNKLTGTITGGKDIKIEDDKYEGGKVSLTVTREFKDQKFTAKYKGKVEAIFGGKDQKRDWEDKREKAKN